jgi:hypothetical protein
MKKPGEGARACLWVRSIADQSLGKSSAKGSYLKICSIISLEGISNVFV